MSNIGTMTKHEDGLFTGKISTLKHRFELRLVPIEEPNREGPHYRAFSGDAELGAGWIRTSKNDSEYVSLSLDDPAFEAPLYANIVRQPNSDNWAIIWSRR